MIMAIKNMSFKYRSNIIFHNANMSIKKQGIYGLVAPNGYGKTTLLNILGGVENSYKGEIKIEKKPISHLKAKDFSYLQSNDILFPYLSGYDHLKFLCDIHKIPYKEINKVALKFDMIDYLKKKVKSYSLGMKQRLLLAMAIIKKPKLILLDEPLTGLDPTSTYIVRKVLKELAKEGVTLILSSHDLNELDKLTSSIFFIKDNKLQFEDLNSNKTNYIYLTVDQASTDLVYSWLKSRGYSTVLDNNLTIVIEVNNFLPTSLLKELIDNDFDIHSYQIRRVTSESVYKSYYMGDTRGEV